MHLQIDGNYGEGGGQILRTTLSLSCILKKPVEIVNIRKGRKIPGLQPQHLTSVSASKRISRAEVQGDALQSLSLRFSPQEIKGGDFIFDVAEKKRSAGSTSLVLQTMLLPLSRCEKDSKITVLGGTHVPWSPPFDYLREVFAPTVKKIGCEISLDITKWGWYPKGGGEVHCSIRPTSKFMPLDLTKRGQLRKLFGISVVSNLPNHIAERQRNQAAKILKEKGFSPEIQIRQAPSIGQGTFFFLKAEFENSVAGFGALGERGKRAEKVAEEACEEFVDFVRSNAAVDRHLADQLIPYLSLADGESIFTVSKITKHLLSNVWVVKQFLQTEIRVEGEEGEEGTVRVNPS
ncbi:MAG: RNA 3'-phosphate cyclase [candidate division Zixibacteria bacterium]|nr:RNA 3'-phosphate cyclase [candidate division Zixibacteria bacterium]